MKYFDGMTTPIGRIHIVVSDRALSRVFLPNEKWSERFTRAPKHPLIVRAKRELREYFSGKRKKFTVPIAVSGTAFQKKAWSALRKIPYGKTMSYLEQAKRMGKRKAVRAVGSANGKNPLPIIVPCHRVISSSGGLSLPAAMTVAQAGGYAGSVSVKKKLLALEQKFAMVS